MPFWPNCCPMCGSGRLWMLCIMLAVITVYAKPLSAGQVVPLSIGDDRIAIGATAAPHQMRELVIDRAGYPLDDHFVETSDGYVLGVYRIPHGRVDAAASRASAAGPRPVVLLQHGLLESSATWVLNRPDESLGFLLADAGFDIWMSNSRGNAFGRNHTGVDPESVAFWDFSFDEMAAFDLPAVVEYVLHETGASQLAYVAHSQGTTIGLAALSSSAALRRRVSLAVMLAPVAFLAHITSYPMLALAEMQADQLVNLLGVGEFLPSRRSAADLFGRMCERAPQLCVSVITAICGFNPRNVNMTLMPEYVQYSPSGTSVRNLVHWAQAVRKSRQRAAAGVLPALQKYDYGDACWTRSGLPRTCNQRVYGTPEPPAYDLTGLEGTRLALFQGGLDRLADPADVQALLGALPPGTVVYRQREPTFEHIDFTWGVEAKDSVYPAVLLLLKTQAAAAAAHLQLDSGGPSGSSTER